MKNNNADIDKNLGENIITIKGNASNMFDKAVFVLKPEFLSDSNSIDFVKEADNILNNYMLQAVFETQNTKNALLKKTTLNYNNIDTKPTQNKIIQNKNTNHNTNHNRNNFIDSLLGFSIFLCSVVMFILLFYI